MAKAQQVAFLLTAFVAAASGSLFAASPVVVDATGRVLGFYQVPTSVDVVRIVSTEGFIAKVNMKTGAFAVSSGNAVDDDDSISTGGVFYTLPGCAGDPYYPVSSPETTKLGGWVFWSELDDVLWYVPKAPVLVQFTAQSSRPLDSGTCSNSSFSGDFTRAYVNDPSVTGISNVPPTAPLRIEVATISDPSGLLLRDGFEAVI